MFLILSTSWDGPYSSPVHVYVTINTKYPLILGWFIQGVVLEPSAYMSLNTKYSWYGFSPLSLEKV